MSRGREKQDCIVIDCQDSQEDEIESWVANENITTKKLKTPSFVEEDVQFISESKPKRSKKSDASVNVEDEVEVVDIVEGIPCAKVKYDFVPEVEIIQPPKKTSRRSYATSFASPHSSSSNQDIMNEYNKEDFDEHNHGDILVNRKWHDPDEFSLCRKEESMTHTRQWYLNIEGTEMSFNPDINDKIDKAFIWQSYCSWVSEDGDKVIKYEIDWTKFTQINVTTKLERKIGYKLVPLKKESPKKQPQASLPLSRNISDDNRQWKQIPRKIPGVGGSTESLCYTIDRASLDSRDTRDQQEYNFAMAQLVRLLPNAELPDRVEYYESPSVTARFNTKKLSFEQISGKKQDPLWVFHGTSTQNVESIMTGGFKVGGVDKGIALAHGAAHGNGVYTAIGPNTPMSYSASADARNGLSQYNFSGAGGGDGKIKIILALALEGNVKGNGVRNVSDSWKPHSDWMIFKDGAQLMPKYVITCKLGSGASNAYMMGGMMGMGLHAMPPMPRPSLHRQPKPKKSKNSKGYGWFK